MTSGHKSEGLLIIFMRPLSGFSRIFTLRRRQYTMRTTMSSLHQGIHACRDQIHLATVSYADSLVLLAVSMERRSVCSVAVQMRGIVHKHTRVRTSIDAGQKFSSGSCTLGRCASAAVWPWLRAASTRRHAGARGGSNPLLSASPASPAPAAREHQTAATAAAG